MGEVYTQSIPELFKTLDSKEQGISGREAESRLKKHGPNEITHEAGETPLQIFISQFKSPIVWVLIAAMIISAGFKEFVDVIVIGIILVFNALFGFYQEYRAEQSIEALQRMVQQHVKVIRDGKEKVIDAKYLVPGDVMLLETGDKVAADARLFKIKNLETQEAALTGESLPIRKTLDMPHPDATLGDQHNMVFSGTIVTSGHAASLVCRTGMDSEMGKIAGMMQATERNLTPLQKQLARFGKWLGVLTVIISIIIFITGIIRDPSAWHEMLLVAVAIAVAAIPEGLPAVITVSLALGVRRMIKRNALMRHLPSVETLGCVSAICTDKTGTLTKNEMTVARLWVGEDIQISGNGYAPEGKILGNLDHVSLLLKIGMLNNNASLEKNGKKWTAIGDPTEACLLTAAMKGNLDRDILEKEYARIDEFEFDSQKKRMTTIHKHKGKYFVFVKGATDILLQFCDHTFQERKLVLSPRLKKEILAQNDTYAKQALRVLGFAYKELSDVEYRRLRDLKDADRQKAAEKNLIFVGMQAMRDPPRKEVKDAIERCHTAGIDVIMITGDHATTASAIAKEIGIIGGAISGSELEKISDAELKKQVKTLRVFARVNPSHKLRIVDALKSNGHVVAMTGDGVNDAPALKKADIGIAMGSGTDVAKEASEMILTDDNFTSIVNAVEEGRGIYDNIRKFINYLLSSNIGEVLVLFIASILAGVFSWGVPLTALLILWINLVTDGPPALALGVDPVASNAMQRKPRKISSHIMSKGMSASIFSTGALIAVATLLAFAYGSRTSHLTGMTMAFATLIMLELARIQMIRSAYKTSMFSNPWLIVAVTISLLLQLLVIYTPLNKIFDTVPLTLGQWGVIGGILAGVIIIGTIMHTFILKVTHEEA